MGAFRLNLCSVLVLLVLGSVGCGPGADGNGGAAQGTPDDAVPDASSADGGSGDAGSSPPPPGWNPGPQDGLDGGAAPPDAGERDAGPPVVVDAGGPADAGPLDAGAMDAGGDVGTDAGPDGPAPIDAGSVHDAGPGVHDAGPGVHDAGSGAHDAGPGAHDAGLGAQDAGPQDPGPGGSGDLRPDLIPDEGALQRSLHIERRTFGADACVVEEACVGGPGERRLLRFATTTLNLGTADLHVGDPIGNPAFEYSECHYHYHFTGFADYRLIDASGVVRAEGHKQAFCLMDGTPRAPGAGPPRYHCDFQGISMGWADTYDVVDCQWIDITGVPEGTYTVEIEVNPDRVIPELDYSNNLARAEVYIPAGASYCADQPEICGDNIDQDCDGVADEGCPPIASNDRCDSAHMLAADGVYRASITGAGADVSPSCGGAGGDVFFRLDLTVEELVYVSTYGSDVDTVLAVYRDSCAGGGLACEDNGCGLVGEHFVGLLEPGVYYFAVKAKQPGASGEVQLKLQRSHCAIAQPLPDASVVYGDTRDELDEERPVCGLGTGPDELWYFTACPGATPARFSTCGDATAFDTMLELREGTCNSSGGYACSADAPSCAADPHASTLDVSLEASTGEGDGLWFLLVDGFSDAEAGPYELSVDIGP